jgi:hypothetical protein
MAADWDVVFDGLYQSRTIRGVTFRKAVLAGDQVTYPSERTLPAGISYLEVGFNPFRGVYYEQARVEVIIWLRDWFGRPEDGATDAELAQLVADVRGDVREGSREHWSRFVVDGALLKYERHRFDQRPDGVVFAVILTLQDA